LNKKKSYDEIRQLSKTDIIQLGLEYINDGRGNDSVNENMFDQIIVWANNESIYIKFSNPIKFIPINSEYYYDITVYILGGGMSYDIYANPHDYEGSSLDTPFFKSTPGSEEIIQFVIDAINQDAGLTIKEDKKRFLKDFEGDLIIRDCDDHYAITRTSTYQESWYKIRKQTGEIYDDGHAHLEPPPEEDDETKSYVNIFE
jgi:hypothetical protein